MALAFYDTNVILYAAMLELAEADRPKRPIAIDMLAERDFAVSGQVLAEFYNAAVHKGARKLSHDEAAEWLDRISEQPCASIDADLVRSGAALSKRYQISYWDGAILAAAHDLGATTLYTEDLNDGQRYGDVAVINPFKSITH